MTTPKVYDLSNGAKYTVTICNNRSLTNWDANFDFEFLHMTLPQ
jgi:hypothetical protein